MADAEISGYFTNHSARRTGSTRLFRAGIDRKLVKETTGHKSDAVDKYQITSADQRALMSHVMANNPKKRCETVSVSPSTSEEVVVKKNDVESGENSVKVDKTEPVRQQINETNVAQIVSELLNASKTEGKRTIKIQIEIISE